MHTQASIPRPVQSQWRKTAQAVWDALSLAGQRRGRREILLLADSVQGSRPELAAQLRAAADNRWN